MIPANEEMSRAELENTNLCRRRAARICSISTAVGVDDPGLHEAHFQVVQNRRLVQVAESSEVVLPNQDVRVAKGGQFWFGRVHGVVAHLCHGGKESADACFPPS